MIETDIRQPDLIMPSWFEDLVTASPDVQDQDYDSTRAAGLGSNQQVFRPSVTASQYIDSTADLAIFAGPFGNGKTHASIMRLMKVMAAQPAMVSNVTAKGSKRIRCAILAASYPKLKRTILRDLFEWLPPGSFTMNQQPPLIGEIKFTDKHGYECVCELFMLAGDSPTFRDDFSGLNVTCVYFVEVQTMKTWDYIRLAIERCGRYTGGGSPHPFGNIVWGCMNWTNADHWTYKKLIQPGQLPPDWELFRGPAAFNHYPLDMVSSISQDEARLLELVFGANTLADLPESRFRDVPGIWVPNPLAENIPNINQEPKIVYRNAGGVQRWRMLDVLRGFAYYYPMLARNEDDGYITRYVLGAPAPSRLGKAVYPNFRVSAHVAKTLINPDQSRLICGTDPGLHHMAFVIGQLRDDGMLIILDELVEESMTLSQFLESEIMPLLLNKYRDKYMDAVVVNDATGDRRDRLSNQNWAGALSSKGLYVEPSVAHEYMIRQDSVNHFFMRHRLLIDPRCRKTIDGFDGDYCYPVKQTGDYALTPDKNSVYSSPVDCVEAICTWILHRADSQWVADRRSVSRSHSPGNDSDFYGFA